MTRMPLVNSAADDEVLQIFDEIRGELGSVPNLFRAYAQHPALLRANWDKFRAIMVEGCLSPRLKEGIALVVSADNHCDYGISHHSAVLQEMGVDPHEVLLIRTDPDHAHYPDKEHALLELARHANTDPFNHGERLVSAARDQGATDQEIVEALGVMELIAGFNHFADVLAVPQ